MVKLCSVESCGRTHSSKGYCAAHYQQVKRHGRVLGSQPKVYRKTPEVCSEPGCTNRARVGPLCDSHSKQVNRYGIESRPLRAWMAQEGACIVDQCDSPTSKRGYCKLHYSQVISGADVTLTAKRPTKIDKTRQCVILNCVRPIARSSGLCVQHRGVCEVYKLTSIQYDALMSKGCMICGSIENMHIDHDHGCCNREDRAGRKNTCGNCVRGALCRNCNLGLGFLKDSRQNLLSALNYLSG